LEFDFLSFEGTCPDLFQSLYLSFPQRNRGVCSLEGHLLAKQPGEEAYLEIPLE
jgi:hypothetical protein